MNTDNHRWVLGQKFGLRRQSTATTALSNSVGCSLAVAPPQSGVALRFPPQSKISGCSAGGTGFIRVHSYLFVVESFG
jgi:hypothetical protein